MIAWPVLVYGMMMGVCLFLAGWHFFLWLRDRRAWAQLCFSIAAVGVLGFSAIELAMMFAPTPERYQELFVWLHVPGSVVVAAFVGFVHFHLKAGRRWLAAAVVVSWFLLVALNLLFGVAITFTRVDGLIEVEIGNAVLSALGMATASPLLGVMEAVHVAWLIYVVDATVSVWKRESKDDRRRAALIGSSMIMVAFLSGVVPTLAYWCGIRWPLMMSLSFAYLTIAIGYELTVDLARAAETAEALRVSQQALRNSEQRLDLALQAAALAPWEWDAVRDEVWIDTRGRAFLGIPEGERIDHGRFLSRVHPQDLPGLAESLVRVATDGGTFERQYRHQRADGTIRWVFSRGSAECDASGRVVRVRGVSVDVTDRVVSNEALAAQRRELAHLLRVALLGELSGSLAHELNQPLASILSNAQTAQRLVERDPIDRAELREILADIVLADSHAAHVIQRVRGLLHNAGEERAPVDLNQLVLETLRLMRIEFRAQGVEVQTELEPSLPSIVGDRVHLQQVLLNLAVNACDAMAGNDGIPRRLIIQTRATNGSAVDVSVSDTSPGIPPDLIRRIFEPFLTTKPHGLGLGLSVCRTIIAAHGGRLTAVNNPDRGTTFRFTLPQPEAHS